MIYKDDTPELGKYINPYPKNPRCYTKEINNKGILVEIEGLDGSGKSTQTKMICERLKKQGYKVYNTNFIHSTYIKQILLKTKWENCDPYTFTLMYAMGLSYVYYTEIIDKLNEGYIVVLDRYIYTIIVKGLVGRVEREWIENLMKNFKESDIKIYIDTSTKECLRRKKETTNYLSYWECGGNVIGEDSIRYNYDEDIFSSLFIKYQEMAKKEYLTYAQMKNWNIVNGETDKNDINNNIYNTIINKLEERRKHL